MERGESLVQSIRELTLGFRSKKRFQSSVESCVKEEGVGHHGETSDEHRILTRKQGGGGGREKSLASGGIKTFQGGGGTRFEGEGTLF